MVGHTGISGWNKIDAALRTDIAEIPELAPKSPTREVLIAADADFLFAGWNYGLRVGSELTPDTLAPYGIALYELTERAAALVAAWCAEVAGLTVHLALGDRPRVFVYDSGEDQPFTAGRYAMPTALIEAAGGTNIMDGSEKSWATVGWEKEMDQDPEVIVIVNYGDVTAA